MRSIFVVVLCAGSIAAAHELEDGGTAPHEHADVADAGAAEPSPADAGEPAAPPPVTSWWQRVEPFGYAKVGVFYNFPIREEQIPGGNGGFRMANLRAGAIFKPIKDLEVVASLEAAAPLSNPADPTSGSRIVALRDAYAEYQVCSGFVVRAGQFKAPYWAETLLPDAQLPFISRSVISDGYSVPEYAGQREGISLDRQVGLQLFSRRLGSKLIGFKYALAVVNGNGANQLLNDNNTVAPVGRLELELFEHVNLGVNGYYNQRSEGVRPTRLVANQLGYGADVSANALGFNMLVGFAGRSTSYAQLRGESALGILGQVGYLHERSGLGGGVRFALFDPSNVDPADDVSEFALMLSWQMKLVPLRVVLQYTHREEAGGVSIPNDSADAMLQVSW